MTSTRTESRRTGHSRIFLCCRSVSSLAALAAAIVGVSSAVVGCDTPESGPGDDLGVMREQLTYAPQPVAHPKTTKRIFAHYMPWFEANGVQHGYTRHGTYGGHWTMANCTAQTNGLLNRVCADDTPMIGPYSSSDPYVVEYHLLLMKYAGIDGVVIDWGGVMNVADLPDNKFNAEALMSQLSNFGLKFQVMMEDRNYVRNNGPNDFNNPVNISDDTNDMANDLNCLKANGTCGNLYFGSGNYERLAGNNTPVVGVFGPTTYKVSNGDAYVWDNAYAQAGLTSSSTTQYTLWWQDADVSNEQHGSTAWVWAGAGAVGTSSWTVEDHMTYYVNNETAPGTNRVKMGAVVPAYFAYYQLGGWSSDAASFSIPYNNATNVDQLFNIVLPSNSNYVQLVTFNDFGEGTEFEPTTTKSFSALNHVQTALGVTYGTNELNLIYNLFQARVTARKNNDTNRLAQLDQASAYLAALNVSGASCIINGTACESPYGGTAWSVPGTVEAENYDIGGEGVAYHDTDAANKGGQYRPADGVDIETTQDTGGGYDVGWGAVGEWMKYTINVTQAGTYQIVARTANASGATATIRLDLDGVNLTGNLTVPKTATWQTWQNVTSGNVTLSAGQHIITYNLVSGGLNLNKFTFTKLAAVEAPYGGTAWAIPGAIEAENFDTGGEGLAYHDADAANSGGQYRTSEGVDIETCGEGGYDVTAGAAGEWMKYTVNVASAGSYKFFLRTANGSGAAATVRLDLDGTNLTGNVSIPTTAGAQTFQDVVTSNVTLGAGQHILTWNVVSGSLNVNRITAVPASNPYTGSAVSLPGQVEVENYDTGGEGLAYHDAEATNKGGAYRTGDGVDVEACSEGGYDVGYTNAGEWMRYQVKATSTKAYTINVRVAAPSTVNAAFYLELDGKAITSSQNIAATGGWQTFKNVTVTGVNINAGLHSLRFVEQAGGYNINYVSLQ